MHAKNIVHVPVPNIISQVFGKGICDHIALAEIKNIHFLVHHAIFKDGNTANQPDRLLDTRVLGGDKACRLRVEIERGRSAASNVQLLQYTSHRNVDVQTRTRADHFGSVGTR